MSWTVAQSMSKEELEPYIKVSSKFRKKLKKRIGDINEQKKLNIR